MKVVSIRRYPVKSMMGEEINAGDITERGIYGDRSYGVIDEETGRLANAKNPKKWPNMFRHHAQFVRPVTLSEQLPPVQISLPNGKIVRSDEELVHDLLTESFSRPVKLHNPSAEDVQFEGYVPEEVEALPDRGTVFTRVSPNETFFDLAMLHIITTNTIDALKKLIPESRIEARRFRPNIIIDVPDVEGFVEESWVGKTVHIGDEVKLKISQPTGRCVMTTLAQGDLPNDINVLKTLVKENSGNFGVYAEILQTGKIHVGDKIVIA